MAQIRSIVALVGWIAVSLAAGAVGGVASVNAGAFYGQLDRPPWAPPGWLFGPVWTTLYVLMGIAAWLVWREAGWAGARAAFVLFLVQLALNALWTWLFFAWRNGALALAGIVVLLIFIIATMIAFGRVSRRAAVLLVPYLCWVLFATALTAAVWTRNRGVL
ncbi:MAG TPA: TspO/MBR family protein [Gemmatimonadaceae bacterium]|jgi:tryptophan-rich sensory protein|nr:TspO/MBR family protein [Gemmatimonadaceae bacterium]